MYSFIKKMKDDEKITIEDIAGGCVVVLGYIDGEQPLSKPRKPGRVQIIE